MPNYEYRCDNCGTLEERLVAVEARHFQQCFDCGRDLRMLICETHARVAGQVAKGGGPDRFTADVMRIPLKDLPDSMKAYPGKRRK